MHSLLRVRFGLGVQGLEFRVWSLGFAALVLGLMSCTGFRDNNGQEKMKNEP